MKIKTVSEREIANIVRASTLDLIQARDAKISSALAEYKAEVERTRSVFPPYGPDGKILHLGKFEASLQGATEKYDAILKTARAEFECECMKREPGVRSSVDAYIASR